jgi:23S rRNA (adenine2503-C2)-methyltransferase
MLSIHDTAVVEAYARRLQIDRHCIRRLRNAFYKRQAEPRGALAELPDAARRDFSRDVEFHLLQLRARHDSRADGASKLAFESKRGLLIETVILRIASGRTSVCVSTQVGCAARCAFCATGTMGLADNLSAGEILDQVVQVNQQLRGEGRRVRNVAFMGMGEPFHNEAAVTQAIDVLASPGSFGLSPRHLLVSTVGIPEAMVRFARRFPQVGLALSLHCARQEIREQIMPLAKRYPLTALRDAAAAVTAIQGRPLMIEYLLLKEVNDSTADARHLSEFLKNLPVHVNLIPYNPIEGAAALRRTELAGRQAFATALRAAGLTVTLRYSLGADIDAACGQLVRRKSRRPASVP